MKKSGSKPLILLCTFLMVASLIQIQYARAQEESYRLAYLELPGADS